MRGPTWKTLAFIVLIAVAARLVLLAVPFAFTPDVYYYDTQAAQALLSGANPYGHHYVVPPSLQTPGAQNSFAYLPGVVLFLSPFGLAGDTRLGLVACDLLVAFALLYMGGKWAALASGAFLLLPVTVLFSTWYPNNTLIGIAMLGLAIAFETRGKSAVSAVFLGAALASSQLVWLVYPFLLIHNLKTRRFKETLLGVGVAGALVAPFLAWNPSAFIHDTVFFELGRPVQMLLTPEPFGINVNPTISGLSVTAFGVGVPLAIKAALLLILLVFLLYRTKSPSVVLLNGSYFLLAAIFILPNDFSWWYLELPFQLLLAWLVLAHGGRGEKTAEPLKQT